MFNLTSVDKSLLIYTKKKNHTLPKGAKFWSPSGVSTVSVEDFLMPAVDVAPEVEGLAATRYCMMVDTMLGLVLITRRLLLTRFRHSTSTPPAVGANKSSVSACRYIFLLFLRKSGMKHFIWSNIAHLLTLNNLTWNKSNLALMCRSLNLL